MPPSSRVPSPHRARVPGNTLVSRYRVRLCVPAGLRANETLCFSNAGGNVPGSARKRVPGALGWERHSERIRCRARHPPSATSSAQRAPASQPVPPRAEEGPEPSRPSGAPPRPLLSLKKKGSSPIKNEKGGGGSQRFKEKQTQASPSLAPLRPQIHSSDPLMLASQPASE